MHFWRKWNEIEKKIMILITLGITLAFSPMFVNILYFNAGDGVISSEHGDAINLDDDNLKISKISGRIHIIGNSGWVNFRNDGNCTGSGIYSDPYVIEDLVIDGGGSGYCIWIENSNVYFRIENCTAYNSRGYPNAGILLSHVNNSQLIDNNCSSNYRGIYLEYSNNNNISGNTANYNDVDGIYLEYCDNNIVSGNSANNNTIDYGIYLMGSNSTTISGNTASYNDMYGIQLWLSDNNTVSGSTANYNKYGIRLGYSDYNNISGNTANTNYYGIYLISSDNNTISGNTVIGNNLCIHEDDDCEGNVIENNDCGGDDEKIPGYDPFFLLGTLSVVAILVRKKLKKTLK